MKISEELVNSYENFTDSFVKILNLTFKDCPDGIVYKDKTLCYKTANSAFCNCYNISNFNGFINKKSADFLTLENQKLVNKVNEAILKDKKPISYIMSSGKKSETIHSITSTPIIFNDEFLGIVSTVKDITQEECLKQQFVSKHFQLKSLIENIPMIIYLQDKDFNYIAGTKPSRDFVDKGYDIYSNIYLNLEKSHKEERLDNNYVITNNDLLMKEKEFLDINGRKHWYKIFKVPINDFNGDVTGIITLANNITSEKQLQAQRETFVASLGHDLKNPTIAQIRGLELLLKGEFGEINPEQKELLEMILDSCRYMNGMLASLLATYRNFSGAVSLNFQEFLFSELVKECVSEMIYVAKDKNIKIIINNETENQFILADRVQLKRVIMNLLSNGIKYAYPDTILKLKIKLEYENLLFEFENKSSYIPDDQQKSIFGQYVTYSSNSNLPGIGLGLYASKKIIDGHSGKIYVKSFIDERNIFGFTIPIKQNKNVEKIVHF